MNSAELERRHLIRHAEEIFPGACITVVQDIEAEVIHLSIDGVTYNFEIGSDDDRYRFVGPDRVFDLPLMDEPPLCPERNGAND
jgi:hypothetical protein